MQYVLGAYLVADEEKDQTHNKDEQTDEVREAKADSERIMEHADDEADRQSLVHALALTLGE